MIRFRGNILLLVFVLSACGTGRRLTISQGDPVNRKIVSSDTTEYNEFFAAEEARLSDDRAKAITLYEQFLIKYPANATAHYNLSQLYLKTFDIKKAEKRAKQAYELEPKNKYFIKHYADVLSLMKKEKEAIGLYNKLIEKDPVNTEEYLYRQYSIYFKQHKLDDALNVLNQLEKRMGFEEEIIVEKIELLSRRGRKTEAITEVDKLLNEVPGKAEYHLLKANIYEDIKDTSGAKRIYEEVVERFPADPAVQLSLVQFYTRIGDSIGYKKVLKKIVANDNIHSKDKMLFLMPLFQGRAENEISNDELLPLLKEVRYSSSPDDKEAILTYADILYFAQKYREASKEYGDYLKLDKSQFPPFMNAMLSYSNLNEPDSVLMISDSALNYFPANPVLHYFRGTTFAQIKEYENAIISLKLSLEYKPGKEIEAQIYSLLGDVYNSLEKYTLSDSSFEKSLEILDDETTLNNYAYFLSLRKERLDKALDMSERSLKKRPGTKTFLDTYGWIFYVKGDYQNAQKYLKQAIDADGTDDAVLFEHLGDIEFKLNHVEEALKLWRKAKSIGDGTPLLDKKIRDGILYE